MGPPLPTTKSRSATIMKQKSSSDLTNPANRIKCLKEGGEQEGERRGWVLQMEPGTPTAPMLLRSVGAPPPPHPQTLPPPAGLKTNLSNRTKQRKGEKESKTPNRPPLQRPKGNPAGFGSAGFPAGGGESLVAPGGAPTPPQP